MKKQNVYGNFKLKQTYDEGAPSTLPQIDSNIEYSKFFTAIAILIIATFAVYFQSLKAPFLLDDNKIIVNNPDIRSLDEIWSKLFRTPKWTLKNKSNPFHNDPSRPLVSLTFALNYSLGKLDTAGYHIFNLLLHIINSSLLFLLLQRVLNLAYLLSNSAKVRQPSADHYPSIYFTALTSSIVFALHPIHVNAVAYIYSRADLICVFFYLSSILFFIKHLYSGWKYEFTAIFCFILSLFSKPIAVSLPFILWVFDYIVLSKSNLKSMRLRISSHIPFWLTLFLYLLFRKLYLGGLGDVEADLTFSRYEYAITQPLMILKYMGTLFLPLGLSFNHSISPLTSIWDPKVILSIGSLIFILFYIWRKTVLSHFSNYRMILFALCGFIIMLSPTSSVFPTTAMYVENRTYLPDTLGCLLIVLCFCWIYRNKLTISANLRPLFILFIVYAAFLGIGTWKQNLLYSNPIALWQDVVRQYPEGARGYTHLARLFDEQGNEQVAIQYGLKAIEQSSSDGLLYSDLGNFYRKAGDLKNALNYMLRAAQVKPQNPEITFNIGQIFQDMNDYKTALSFFQEAANLNPNGIETTFYLGSAYFHERDYTQALDCFKRILILAPDHIEAINNCGIISYLLGNYEKASEYYEKAIQLDPTKPDFHSNMALVLIAQGQDSLAIEEYKKALYLGPNYLNTYINLGQFYIKKNKLDQALDIFLKASSIAPANINISETVNYLKKIKRTHE